MSKFYVGQRVRLVRTILGEYLGLEATVQAVNARYTDANDQIRTGGVWVLVDGCPNPKHDSKCYGCPPDWIEPLTPPKQQETVTWDEACFDRDGRYREVVTIGEAA